MGRLDGKVAVVTGAVSGIGAATVDRFAAEGAVVVGWDVTPHAGGITLDVRDEPAVADAMRAVVRDHGRLDAVVHAAGVAGGGPAHLLDAAEWERVVSINLTGTFVVDKHAIAVMLEQDPLDGERGAIVNIASVEGLAGTEGGSSYNAAKGGVVILTKNLAIDYGRSGIRVNSICPGFIDTPMLQSVFAMDGMGPVMEDVVAAHQLGRLGRAEEIAAAALFLCSSDASFVTGVALPVDGGYTAGHRHGVSEMFGLE